MSNILARHRGWLQKTWHVDLDIPDAYLDRVEPSWRSTALADAVRANLCNADLQDERLDDAILTGADLRGANLVGTHLSGAHLSGADLSGADMWLADLHNAYLGADFDLTRGHGLPAFLLHGADLSGARLNGANLAGAHLVRARLRKSELRGANLACIEGHDKQQQCTELNVADLTGADLSCQTIGIVGGKDELRCANLTGARLPFAKLIGSDLRGASFSNAKLDYADLSGADLTCYRTYSEKQSDRLQTCTDLSGADLSNAQLSKAKLAGVDLASAVYAPVSEPPDPYVAGVRGLDKVGVPSGERTGLMQLRKLLKDAGLGDEERQATYSIERSITVNRLSSRFLSFGWLEGVLRTVGFEWTTAYGLHPEWALRWILLLAVILTPIYTFTILHPSAESGVVQVFPSDRLDGTAGNPSEEKERKKNVIHARGWPSALAIAAYFSVISAVNIGFEQFTPGDWIRRLQRRAYSLEAVGWVRVIAGTQALLRVYLLAMWVLTQFGHPFG